MTIELTRVAASGDAPRPTAQRVKVGRHEFLADMSVEEGGADEGPNPHDLYDAALGACKALTVLWYARKKGIPVEDVQTSVERDGSQERAGTYKLTATLRISGDLTDAQLQELAAVADKCPVHKLMTRVITEVSTSVQRLA